MPIIYAGIRDTTKRGKLKWSPPDTSSGTWRTIMLTNSATGRQTRDPLNTSGSNAPFMDPNVNYIVVQAEPITVSGGIEINGGKNVIFKGGYVNFPIDYATSNSNRALFIKGNSNQSQSRVIHIEGFRAEGYLREGVNVDSQAFVNSNQLVGEPNLTVRLQNMNFVDVINGTQATNHADFFQCYNGPTNVQMDRIYAKTQYQALMIQPHQFGLASLGTYELNRCYFEGTDDSGVLLYMVSGNSNGSDRPNVSTNNVWLRPSPSKASLAQVMLENQGFWGTGVKLALNGRTSFVSSIPGPYYVSPGYEDAA